MTLSYDKECLFSGLPMATCSHCTGDDDLMGVNADYDYYDDYEVLRTFEAQFHSHCLIDENHRVRRGDRVAMVRRADNPMLPVRGVACASCTKVLPRAKS